MKKIFQLVCALATVASLSLTVVPQSYASKKCKDCASKKKDCDCSKKKCHDCEKTKGAEAAESEAEKK